MPGYLKALLNLKYDGMQLFSKICHFIDYEISTKLEIKIFIFLAPPAVANFRIGSRGDG